MVIEFLDCFYIAMIAVIFGFIIHLECQIYLVKTMIEKSLARNDTIKDIRQERKERKEKRKTP